MYAMSHIRNEHVEKYELLAITIKFTIRQLHCITT